MEQNFQTSFIPKKPMIKDTVRSSRPIGFLTIVAIFFLFAVVLSSGALYFYKGIEQKSLLNKQASLDAANKRFESSKIVELQILDKRLTAANEILSKHIAVTPIFKALQAVTMKSVRFTKFSYSYGNSSSSSFGSSDAKSNKVDIKMSGTTLGYSYLALQSDLFGNNKNFIEPVFSNLALSDNGNVNFDLTFSVDPSFVDYKFMLQTESKQVNIPDNTTNTTNSTSSNPADNTSSNATGT